MTRAGLWRARRNLTIWSAHRAGGLSMRLLSDVFDLARSRVAAVVAEVDARRAAGETGHPTLAACRKPRVRSGRTPPPKQGAPTPGRV